MWTILAWICAAAISLLSLKYFTISYSWIFFAGATAFFVTAATDKGRRALWFNIACIAVGLALFEYYLWNSSIRGSAEHRTDEGNDAELIHAPHEKLGWAPQPGTVANGRVSYQGEVIYDATYNIGSNGLRVSPPSVISSDPSAECILFFGGSFMFGQGLEDHQTVPFLVQTKSSQQNRTYNFGVPGYGAHQMLAALQHGMVVDTIECNLRKVSHVFYQGITDHIRRAAGRLWWNTRGPRYTLNQEGGVVLSGRFEDHDDYQEDRSLLEFLGTQVFKSNIYREIVQGAYVRQHSEEEIDLYLGIVEEARAVVRADFPAAEFHVLWWDEANLDNRAVSEGLRQRGISVHLMSDILPNYRPDELNQEYRLHPRDSHPNALANGLMAQYIVRQILGGPATEPEVGAVGPTRQSTTTRLWP